MRKIALALFTSMSLSASVFAATDLVTDVTKTNLFYGASSTSLQTAGFLVSSGTDKYVLEHYNSGGIELDKTWQWYGASMPTTALPVGTLYYKSSYPGIQEGSIAPPQCTAFVKIMSNADATGTWIKGISLGSANLTLAQLQNKAIATFFGANGTYNGHAAVLLSPEISGGKLVSAWVVDQNWSFDGRINKRKMYVGGSGVNNLANYYVVQK